MGRTQVREQLIEYSARAALAYELEGSAGPFANARSRWSTRERADGTTELVVEGRFVPRSWFSRHCVWLLAKPMLERLTRQVLCELDAYVARTA
jgi:hypothetical protein